MRRLRRKYSAGCAALALAPALTGCAEGAASGGFATVGLLALAAAGAGAAAWQYGQLRRTRRDVAEERRRRDRLEAVLASVEGVGCGWSHDGVSFVSPELPALLGVERIATIEDVADALKPGDAAALLGAFEGLRTSGTAFDIEVEPVQGRRILTVRGARGRADGATEFDVLWWTDVTARRREAKRQDQTRASLERRHTELRSILDMLPIPAWLRSEDMSIDWCNRAYAEMADATRQQVIDEQRELLTGPFAKGREMAAEARRVNAPRSELQHVVFAGQRRLYEFVEAPLGRNGLGVGYALDRTEGEELRAELTRHVSAHAEVLEQMNSGIAIYGPDQRLKFYNSAFAQLWRLDENWLDSEPPMADVLEDLRARRMLPEQSNFAAYKRHYLQRFTSLIEPLEELEHRPDGTTLRVLTTPHPLGGLLQVMEDVTSRLALEESYNTAVAVQRETLDHLAEGVAVFGGDGRLRLSNPAFLRIWRLDPVALSGQPHIQEVVDRMRPLLEAEGTDWTAIKDDLIEAALDRVAHAERLILNDGTILDVATVPLPDGAVLNSYLDVTDTVRIEQALRRSNAALETADRLKSEFIANVSYQLRTPLNAIQGFTEILLNQYFGPLNPRQAEYTRSILDSSDRLLKLIDDILDLATVEAGYMALERGSIDVPSMLLSVEGLAREWTRKRDLELRFDVPADLGVIEGDERRLKQALLNVVSNAVKFTPDGGRISLTAERAGDDLSIAVSDTGPGVPEEDRERVFGSFVRANTRQAGAGLGLALVKSFIELHGGEVRIAGNADGGTTVTCLLPVHGPANPSILTEEPLSFG